MDGRVDVAQLYKAIEAERKSRAITAKQVAAEAGVSASLLSRMGKGFKPDLESFAALVQWLRVPAESFLVPPNPQGETSDGAAFETRLLPMLRAEKDLSEKDREYILQLVTATMRYLKADAQEL